MTFKYILAHPWIQVLDAHALLTSPISRSVLNVDPVAVDDTHTAFDILTTALQHSPPNSFTTTAMDALQSLYGPVYPISAGLPALRRHYLTTIWSLLSAAEWAHNPFLLSSCDIDLDHDNQAECLLTSDKFYAQFEIEDGSLTYLFARLPDGEGDMRLHQIVAPSAQS